MTLYRCILISNVQFVMNLKKGLEKYSSKCPKIWKCPNVPGTISRLNLVIFRIIELCEMHSFWWRMLKSKYFGIWRKMLVTENIQFYPYPSPTSTKPKRHLVTNPELRRSGKWIRIICSCPNFGLDSIMLIKNRFNPKMLKRWFNYISLY